MAEGMEAASLVKPDSMMESLFASQSQNCHSFEELLANPSCNLQLRLSMDNKCSDSYPVHHCPAPLCLSSFLNPELQKVALPSSCYDCHIANVCASPYWQLWTWKLDLRVPLSETHCLSQNCFQHAKQSPVIHVVQTLLVVDAAAAKLLWLVAVELSPEVAAVDATVTLALHMVHVVQTLLVVDAAAAKLLWLVAVELSPEVAVVDAMVTLALHMAAVKLLWLAVHAMWNKKVDRNERNVVRRKHVALVDKPDH